MIHIGFFCLGHSLFVLSILYDMATMNRLLAIWGLFCKNALFSSRARVYVAMYRYRSFFDEQCFSALSLSYNMATMYRLLQWYCQKFSLRTGFILAGLLSYNVGLSDFWWALSLTVATDMGLPHDLCVGSRHYHVSKSVVCLFPYRQIFSIGHFLSVLSLRWDGRESVPDPQSFALELSSEPTRLLV